MKTYSSLPNFTSVPHAEEDKSIRSFWLDILEVKFEQVSLNVS